MAAPAPLVFVYPFIPAISTGFERREPKRIGNFLIWEGAACLLLLLIYVYLGEVAPHQGIVCSKVFSGKSPYVEAVWDVARYGFIAFGALMGAFFVILALRQRKTI